MLFMNALYGTSQNYMLKLWHQKMTAGCRYSSTDRRTATALKGPFGNEVKRLPSAVDISLPIDKLELEPVTWSFRRDAGELCVLLVYYAASNGNPLQTFRDNVSVPSSRVKKSKSSWTSWPLKMGPIRCPETSVNDYHSTLRNIPEECNLIES
jgi:hypothetical protein